MTRPDNTTGDQDSGLEDFGYKESLDRSIGKFASFAERKSHRTSAEPNSGISSRSIRA